MRCRPGTPVVSRKQETGVPDQRRTAPLRCALHRVRDTCGMIIVLIALSVVPVHPAHAQSVEDFYRGKSVNLLIGFGVGGGYDLYARVLGKYIGKHIPGNPTIVPQNMTGAGSLRAAQFLYSAAP